MHKVLLSEMTYLEVAEVLERPHVAVISTGATEQHGPHLPLDVDTRIASTLCKEAATKVEHEIGVVVAPPVPFGISEHHMNFAGTLSINAETFISLIYQVGRSLVHHGFRRLVIVNGHGGNVGALQIIAQKLRLDGGASHAVYLSEWDLARHVFASVRESGLGGASHACEYETSVYLHLQPDLVQMDKALREIQPPLVSGSAGDLFNQGLYHLAVGQDYSRTGVEGDPLLASAEKGKRLYEVAVENLAKLLVEVALL